MGFIRRHLSTAIIGVLLVGGVSYVAAQEATRTDDVVLSSDETADEMSRGRPHGPGPMGHPGFHRAVRGELVVEGEEEGTFNDVRIDRGVVDRVDGTTIVIEEADGEMVDVPTDDETAIRRDGDDADVGDLEPGDHVFTVRVDEGDGFTTRRVMAISAERYAEMQERREACRADPESCRPERAGRPAPPRGGGRPF